MSIPVNPVNWFEIPVQDLSAAKKFYESAFETELSDMEMGSNQMACFPMDMNSKGATGALIKGPQFTPSDVGSLVYLNVNDIEATLERIESGGGSTLMPKTSIGEHGFIAHFKDNEGNRVALHEYPVSA